MTGNDLNPCTPSSPCRSFNRAITVVAAGGEVIPLDSGGYGSISIGKSVTVNAPAGVHAAITGGVAPAIDITAPANSVIILRGLSISGAPAGFSGGDRTGIASLGANNISLHVENCTITGFDFGIRFFSPGRISVKDSFVREATAGGIWIAGTSAFFGYAHGLIDNVRADFNGHGVWGSASDFAASAYSEVLVRNSVSLRSFRGFLAAGTTPAGDPGPAKMTIVGSAGIKNYASVLAAGHATNQGGTATIVISDSTIVYAEVKGIEIHPNGAIHSKGNNTLNNAADDPFSSTTPLQ